MTEDKTPLTRLHWLLAASVALVGTVILFDVNAGINGAIWVTLAVLITLLSRRGADFRNAVPSLLLGAAAVVAAGAAALTTDVAVHVGIFWLTAVLLAAFLVHIPAQSTTEVELSALLTSPFVAAARAITSSVRELGAALKAATESPAKAMLRRVILIAPVVLVLIFLLGGADPVIQSVIDRIQAWFPEISFGPRAVFFTILLVVLIGASSRLPDLKFALPPRDSGFRLWPSAGDGFVLVASTLATLVLFLLLQAAYLFVRLPNQMGNGVTYADYARRGFGQLCVVVTIVVGVILLAEKSRDPEVAARERKLRTMEFATIVSAGLILLSALRRIMLYEQAYGYTVSRVHATAYVVFMAVLLVLLVLELRRESISPALGRRAFSFALVAVLVILYWNDQAWIMNRNIDRVHTTGKFDADYASRLSGDALPVLVARRAELPPDARTKIEAVNRCNRFKGPFAWYEWNPVRNAASAAADTMQSGALKCSIKSD